jgi:hypothetical protein
MKRAVPVIATLLLATASTVTYFWLMRIVDFPQAPMLTTHGFQALNFCILPLLWIGAVTWSTKVHGSKAMLLLFTAPFALCAWLVFLFVLTCAATGNGMCL